MNSCSTLSMLPSQALRAYYKRIHICAWASPRPTLMAKQQYLINCKSIPLIRSVSQHNECLNGGECESY